MNRLLRFGFTLFSAWLLTLPANAAVTPWYDLNIEDGRLMLPTMIAGIPGQSIIDTGAEVTAINSTFMEHEQLEFDTGRRVALRGVYGEQKRRTYRKVPGSVLDTPVTFASLVSVDLGAPDVQLLLGANFFEDYIFQFDYTNARMRLITRDEVDLKAIRNIDAKKDKENNQLVVRVEFDGVQPGWLMMDTGSNGGLLVERSFAEIQDWIGKYPTEQGRGSGVVSGSQMENFRIPSIEVGPFQLENVLVSMPSVGEKLMFFEKDSETGTRFAKRNLAQGLLGYDVLKHFVVTIDYQRGYVHFYPGEKVDED